MGRQARKAATVLAGVVLASAGFWAKGYAVTQGQVREITVVGDQYTFSPARIEVQKDDLVRVTFTAKDVAHSFTVDLPYRISKRAASGHSIVFEFRADETGTFTFYCNLTQDDRCRQMKGQLIVR